RADLVYPVLNGQKRPTRSSSHPVSIDPDGWLLPPRAVLRSEQAGTFGNIQRCDRHRLIQLLAALQPHFRTTLPHDLAQSYRRRLYSELGGHVEPPLDLATATLDRTRGKVTNS